MGKEIFLDMDDTIAALSEHVIKIYNEETGENFDWRSNRKWMWTDANKIKEKYFHNILHRKNIFRNCEVLGGQDTVDYVNNLILTNKVYIITSPMLGNSECFKEKIKWIKQKGFQISERDIIFIQDKGLCAAKDRILVDDKIRQLDNWSWNDGLAICMNQGWNQSWAGKRIFEIQELDRYL